jgi:hypothetical protein
MPIPTQAKIRFISALLISGFAIFIVCKIALDQPVEVAENVTCATSDALPDNAVFQNLSAVNLYIQVDPMIREAFDCHGREEQCVSTLPDAQRPEPIARLKKYYELSPASFKPDAIQSKAVNAAQQKILPFLKSKDCKLSVLSQKEVYSASEQDDVLTMTIELRLIEGEDKSDSFALLNVHRYRPGCKYYTYHSQKYGTSSTVIPLSKSHDQISETVDKFLKREISVGLTNKSHVY